VESLPLDRSTGHLSHTFTNRSQRRFGELSQTVRPARANGFLKRETSRPSWESTRTQCSEPFGFFEMRGCLRWEEGERSPLRGHLNGARSSRK
jgi:hypothetical protein